MTSGSSAPSSTVIFPVSEPSPRNVQPVPYNRVHYLPFRRISLPTAPSKLHRESMISVASFDSMPEDSELHGHLLPAIIQNVHPPRNGKAHSSTTDSPRRRWRSHVPIKPTNEAKLLKRRKVIEEFYETERAYLDGLELIYSHFLSPIISSLDTSDPLLDRSSLTSVFSNFIDIWNLHRSFFSSLTTLLTPAAIPSSVSIGGNHPDLPPSLSPILLSHFPYLSLYNPFVTSFPSTISGLADLATPPSSTRANPKYNPTFAAFLSEQESDPRCGKLKLRDWLLTIVQRCPRYLLLLKDLIGCTDEEDPEHVQLISVHTLVSKIMLSLNSSLHTHAQTLALLSLQRATPNLPFQLIVPGRTLLKRGPLLQIERSGQAREREFLLFSDCFIWLAGEDAERAQWKSDWGISRSGWGAGYADGGSAAESSTPEPSSPVDRPRMQRSRSKSEAELSLFDVDRNVTSKTSDTDQQEQPPATPAKPSGRSGPRRSYHPPANLINRRRNASSGGDERWVYKGRAELVDLEVIVTPTREEGEERRFEVLSPEGSFVLYAGTEEERGEWSTAIRHAKAELLVSLNVTHPNSTLTSSSSTNHLRRSLQALPFPPADEHVTILWASKGGEKKSKDKGKADGELPERRRKVEHWVPAIWIPDDKTSECMRCGKSFGWRRRRHHCRLCGRCVCASCSGQTFFISDPNSKDSSSKPARACDACYETVFPLIDTAPGLPDEVTGIHRKDTDSIPSLNHMPSWLSIPSLPIDSPQVLMAIDRKSSSPRRHLQDLPLNEGESRKQVRARPLRNSRPRSYNQVWDEFDQIDQGRFDMRDTLLEDDDDGAEDNDNDEGTHLTPGSSLAISDGQASLPSSPRKENTARRNKRFSLPAVALHTTNVTARTSNVDDSTPSPVKASKRFSLLGSSHNRGGTRHSEAAVSRASEYMGQSVAIGKLNELLGRKVAQVRI